MRILILLQGIPASGKTTWVKENGLENYVISSDEIRKNIGATYLDIDGWTLDQTSNKEMFDILHQMVEVRFKQGALTIVDATHLKEKDISAYNKLCKQYGYRRYIVRFDISLEEAIKRDSKRGTYSVGEKVITRCYDRFVNLQNPSGWVTVSPNAFSSIEWRSEDLSGYEHVNVFGDIHGCINPVKAFFEKYPYSEKEFYIFTGDYLDRGPNNKETLEAVLKLSTKKNVVFCCGNHELHLIRYLDGEPCVSKDFLKTSEEIEHIDRKELRDFVRSLHQMYLFDFKGERYFVNHGGLPWYPNRIIEVPTVQFIKGVGGYDIPVDEYYERYSKDHNVPIQIHGHRNLNLDNGTEHSINLEGGVERGGMLKVWRNGEILCFENHITNEDFRSSPLIKVKKLKSGAESYNFTKEAFYGKEWNHLTITARGLFMLNEKVVARGYNKFFNIGENPQTDWDTLLEKKGKVRAYLKENGFLGLLSYYEGKLRFHTKSTDEGSFAGYFKNIYYKLPINHDAVEEWLKNNDYTLVFEVIDINNDPHIVEYDNDRLVLLDAIKNDLEFSRIGYEELSEIAKLFNCEVKQLVNEFSSFSDFKNWLNGYNPVGLEGLVLECGDYMCKYKTSWYLSWKKERGKVERIRSGLPVEEDDFTIWIKEHPEYLNLPLVSQRKIFKNR